MDERTLRPGEMRDAATVHAFPPISFSETIGKVESINGWLLIKELKNSEYSTVYFAKRSEEEMGVLKLYHQEKAIKPTLRKASQLGDKRLLRIIEVGVHEGKVYEVTPHLENGSLDGQVIDSQTLKRVIIPQLSHAIAVLHKNRLLHNDIKPSNLFWIKKGEEIALGDYDTVSLIDSKEATGGTKEYMAPEVMLSGHGENNGASDYCSMGLTLISLITGASPLHGKSDVQIRRTWMRGIEPPENVEPQLRTLIKALTQYHPNQRMNAESLSHWMRTYGIVEESVAANPISQQKKDDTLRPIYFRDYPVLHIEEMIDVAGKQWELACFMLKQKRFSPYLRQFDIDKYRLCLYCEGIFDINEGLFTLLHSLLPSEDFYWYGDHYDNLESFATAMLDTEEDEVFSRGAHFLRSNMLGVYLKNNGAGRDRIELAGKLSSIARTDPELALTQLVATMSAMPELSWHGQVFRSLREMVEWLLSVSSDLDDNVSELYKSKRFEAWLNFIGQGSLLDEIRNDLKGISL